MSRVVIQKWDDVLVSRMWSQMGVQWGIWTIQYKEKFNWIHTSDLYTKRNYTWFKQLNVGAGAGGRNHKAEATAT